MRITGKRKGRRVGYLAGVAWTEGQFMSSCTSSWENGSRGWKGWGERRASSEETLTGKGGLEGCAGKTNIVAPWPGRLSQRACANEN